MDQANIEMENHGVKELADVRPFVYSGTDLESIDYVLVYSKSELEKDEKKMELREKFEAALCNEGLTLESVEDPKDKDIVFVRLHTSFDRLAQEAENIKIEVPLAECQIYDDTDSCFETLEQKYFVTDNEDDFVSAPFFYNRFHMYKGNNDKSTFFRSSLRAYLTHHILIHTDIRETHVQENEPLLAKKALPHLLMSKVYIDAFMLHEPSVGDPIFTKYDKKRMRKDPETPETKLEPTVKKYVFENDHRQALDDTWVQFCKYQPMWKIRNYFGEKIAFYFAWSGHLISWLWFPSVLGFICFVYGLYLSIEESTKATPPTNTTLTGVAKVSQTLVNMLGVVKSAFDNIITPFFALSICIWGTILTETWKRTRHRLAYEWDVNNFSDTEPDRPQFVGTTRRMDPVTKEEDYYYPMRRQFMKFCASFAILLFMICIVFISVASIILYRVIVTVEYCSGKNVPPINCFFVNVIVSSVLNAVLILLLGKLYDWIAMKLTDWENHRTQTAYDDALIIKLFAFQFANSYSSLVYIAFFRGNASPFAGSGVFGLGKEYTDSCGGDTDVSCMPMLSFQVMILMLMKPLPKLLKDIILPFAIRLLHKLRNRCCKKNQIEVETDVDESPENLQFHLDYERKKPTLDDFTIGEYMEKVIQYGYLMLFASSFPLAPILALFTNMFDRLVDAKRLLWMYRRPNPQIVQNIGMWEWIMEFLNGIGVITNAFIIAFTSKWGRGFDVTTRLVIVLGIEHAVFAIKLFTMAIIPDIPGDVQLSIRREKYQVQKILETGDLKASSLSLGRHRRDSRSRSDGNPPNILSQLPLNMSDSSRSHPPPSSQPHSEQNGGGQGLRKRDSFNTHEARLPFDLYSEENEVV